jgi:nitroimidazol reductase NimA-like FMN-containing flavoprotein (pyridoxamine 5'-phosphate oxidase superfamily)
MRRKDKEITDKSVIERILNSSVFCRIAISDKEAPYLVPLNFGYSDNALYFHSAREGRKIDLLKQNNRVCFEIDCGSEISESEKSCGWTTRYRSVIGYGNIEIISNPRQIKEGLDIIMSHYGRKENTYDEKYFERIVILKLTIDRITGKQSGDWE